MFKSILGPKLVSAECIPGRKWVYKNLWGNRKIIERYDTTVEPVSKATDSDFSDAMKKVKIYIKSSSTKENKQFEQIIKQGQPMKITTYEIINEIDHCKTRVIGLIRCGDKKFSYFQAGYYGNDIPIISDITNGGLDCVI